MRNRRSQCSIIYNYSIRRGAKEIPYFLEYSPDIKLNPVSNWARVNFRIWTEKFIKSFLSLDFNPLSISTWVIMDHEIN